MGNELEKQKKINWNLGKTNKKPWKNKEFTINSLDTNEKTIEKHDKDDDVFISSLETHKNEGKIVNLEYLNELILKQIKEDQELIKSANELSNENINELNYDQEIQKEIRKSLILCDSIKSVTNSLSVDANYEKFKGFIRPDESDLNKEWSEEEAYESLEFEKEEFTKTNFYEETFDKEILPFLDDLERENLATNCKKEMFLIKDHYLIGETSDLVKTEVFKELAITEVDSCLIKEFEDRKIDLNQTINVKDIIDDINTSKIEKEYELNENLLEINQCLMISEDLPWYLKGIQFNWNFV